MEIEAAPESKASNLPKWLLDMKLQLEASKASHKKTEDQIAGLQGHVKKLSEHINTTLPAHHRHRVEIFARSLSNPIPTRCDLKHKRCLIVLVPNEVLSHIMNFCDIKSIHRCEIASKMLRSHVSLSTFWILYFKQHFSFVSRYFSPIHLTTSSTHHYIIRYFQQMNMCCRFLLDLKNEQFVSRHRSAKAHLYDAHHTLTTFLYLTCFAESSVHDLIVKHEGIRIFVKFLAHESGLLHQIACEIIANLLFARHARSICVEDCPVCLQLKLANARRTLLSLLTSPTATVTLSTTHHYSAENISTTTANVQGVACQAASRALINFFIPTHSIPLPCSACSSLFVEDYSQLCGTFPPTPTDTDLGSMLETSQQLKINEYTPFELRYYHKSGGMQKNTTLWLKFFRKTSSSLRADGMTGKGIDDNGHFLLFGSLQVEIEGPIWQMRLVYLSHDIDIIDWLFVEDELTYSNMRSQITFKAYWSDGRPAYSAPSSDTSVPQKTVGKGFWGVWEICSIGSHFELQKGGVFLATPNASEAI